MLRVNAGGTAFTDAGTGRAWMVDSYFIKGNLRTTTSAITGSGTLLPMYQTNRFFVVGNSLFTTCYSLPLPAAGAYTVRLYFANFFIGA